MQCHDCHFSSGYHHDFCPTARPQFRPEYKKGREAGRTGQPDDHTAHGAWRLGWLIGDAAAEEAENSER